MTIYLDYYRAEIVDRFKFYNTYSSNTGGYKLLKGSPLLVSVEGSLIDSSTIMDLVINRNQRVLSALNRWLTDLKMPSNVNDGVILELKWRR